MQMTEDFRELDTTKAWISIFEVSPRVLGMYSETLSEKAESNWRNWRWRKFTQKAKLPLSSKGESKSAKSGFSYRYLVGNRSCGFTAGQTVSKHRQSGRVSVQPDLPIPRDKNIFVIGGLIMENTYEYER
jgi:NADH dehydrogenase FAD-containing subunit